MQGHENNSYNSREWVATTFYILISKFVNSISTVAFNKNWQQVIQTGRKETPSKVCLLIIDNIAVSGIFANHGLAFIHHFVYSCLNILVISRDRRVRPRGLTGSNMKSVGVIFMIIDKS